MAYPPRGRPALLDRREHLLVRHRELRERGLADPDLAETTGLLASSCRT
jgi:hypothetical protein